MKRIILTELYKLPRKSNYILLGLAILIHAGISYIMFSQLNNISGQSSFIDSGGQSFSLSLNASGILLSIFIIMNIGQEYKDGTLRKNIIDGFTRNDFYVGKISILLIAVIFVFLLSMFSTTIAAIAMGKSIALQELFSANRLLPSFIKLAYTALFATFLIFTLRKTTISIVLYFLWQTIEGILNGLQHILTQQQGLGSSFNLQAYLPLSSLEFAIKSTEIITPKAIAVTSIYVLIFILLPYYIFRKADLKS